MGHEPTLPPGGVMSALPLKADISQL